MHATQCRKVENFNIGVKKEKRKMSSEFLNDPNVSVQKIR